MNHRQKRILVVEDETIVALDLQSSLTLLGYEVVGTASSGEEAIAKAESTRPDLVLMDIILNGDMDGVQAAETIHSMLNVPVIFLTACADEKTLDRAKVSQPFGYLIKPFEERELRSQIEIAVYKQDMEKQLRESEERYSLATQGANDGLWDWDVSNQKIYFSPRWKSMLGYQEGQIGSAPADWFDRIHPADREQVKKQITRHLSGRSSHFESEYRILDSDGAYRWVLCRGMARRDKNGEAYRFAGSQTDITDRKVYNPLTGLPNKILFMDRLEQVLRRKESQNKSFGVAVVEISGLKAIASSFGYVFADQLLCRIARTMQKCLSPNDTIAHFGNDDFGLILEGAQEAKQAAIAASSLLHELERPFQVDAQTVCVSVSIGITQYTPDYSCPDELVRDAYAAVHRVKDSGLRRFEVFDQKMRSSVVARLKLEADLRRAFEQKEFKIHYQPIMNLKTGELAGFEALLRWQKEGTLMYPEDFLAMADATDLLVPLERWVLFESCMQMARWTPMHKGSLTLNVNLCPKHYANHDLVGELKEALQRSRLDPRLLRLEITESSLMTFTDVVSQTLTKIRDMNIQLHMDDFGTGYSSLSYLNQFPINSLKVDRSFIGKLGLCEETWKIVQAIVTLGQNLDKELIAEGIENVMQLRMLQTLRCDYGQGYYFAKPMPPEDVENFWMPSRNTRMLLADKSGSPNISAGHTQASSITRTG